MVCWPLVVVQEEVVTTLMDGDINLSIVMTFVSNIVAIGKEIICSFGLFCWANLLQMVYTFLMVPYVIVILYRHKVKAPQCSGVNMDLFLSTLFQIYPKIFKIK